MSVATTMQAWRAWLAAQAPPLNSTTYAHSPPWPFAGTYPYVIVMADDQSSERYSSDAVYWSGWWRLIYVAITQAPDNSVSALLEAAGAWAEALKTTLQANDTNRRLNDGTIDYAAESGEGGGPGVIVRWSQIATGQDGTGTPYWAIPIEVFVRERATSG